MIHIAFRVADEQGLLLLDLKDLRALLNWIGDNRAEVSNAYGNVASQSIGAIQRRLLVLEDAGGDKFFGEPALELQDLLNQDLSGRGVIHLLDATKLINEPRLYATFLLWLLSELFEELEEVGDQELPRCVFFFDEAHLLFDHASEQLLEKIEQIVRLIRSRGVGIYFVTQHPLDIPDSVLGQLGNRFQHVLRAFTPRDQKAVKSAARTFRQNPAFSAEDAITNLSVGEALVSVLDQKGSPKVVERSPPKSRIGPASTEQRQVVMSRSPVASKYGTTVDRESAFELLKAREIERAKAEENTDSRPHTRKRQSVVEAFTKSLFRSFGSQIGRQLFRGLLGSITRSP